MQPDAAARQSSHDSTSAEQRFLLQLEQLTGANDFRRWFFGKVAVRADAEQLTIGVASPFLLTWMQKRFRRQTAAAAQAVLGPSAVVLFSVAEAASFRTAAGSGGYMEAFPVADREEGVPVTTPLSAAAPEPPPAAPLKQGRRFKRLSDFVPGGPNELPLLAAAQVGQSPGGRYNPLFLYGNHGCGKTHLLEGIYCEVRRRHPTLKTVYLTAEAFTNYFTQALRGHSLPGLRERFRTCDVLLVDDVDFLEGKTATQEEFLHTFDQLARNGRQVVVSSDRHPRLLERISGELATRFISGLTCRVQVPDFDGRLEILECKTRELRIAVKPEALRHVAGKFNRNVAELLGALNCLATQHELTDRPVGMTAARSVLCELERDCLKMVGLPDIERAVCEFFRVTPKDLKSAKRTRSISQPRMLAMFLMRKHTRAAYSEIGDHFGGRNHATVISAEKRVRDWITTGETVRVATETWPMSEVVAAIEQRLAG
jgi:chromosomal replication initiator protein